MQKNTVDEMLFRYREYVGRCGHLESLIANEEKQLKRLRANVAEELVGGGSVITGMPHGSGISDPTSRIGIALAEGYTPEHIKELERELDEAREELNGKLPTVIFVEAWLKGLTEKERWIVEAQVIDKYTWGEVAGQHITKFGATTSKNTLKRLKNRALDKIYQMAE